MDKPTQRAALKTTLQHLHNKPKKSTAICKQLQQWLTTHQPPHLGAFVPSKTEPNIWPVLRDYGASNPLFLPQFNASTNRYQWAQYKGVLVKGPFGISEPPSPSPPLLPKHCLVPALGIDHHGNRLGWGHGFFDRLLSPTMPDRIGIVFECQCICHIPADPWDIPVTAVITETAIVNPPIG